jgi:hypothetical protein
MLRMKIWTLLKSCLVLIAVHGWIPTLSHACEPRELPLPNEEKAGWLRKHVLISATAIVSDNKSFIPLIRQFCDGDRIVMDVHKDSKGAVFMSGNFIYVGYDIGEVGFLRFSINWQFSVSKDGVVKIEEPDPPKGYYRVEPNFPQGLIFNSIRAELKRKENNNEIQISINLIKDNPPLLSLEYKGVGLNPAGPAVAVMNNYGLLLTLNPVDEKNKESIPFASEAIPVNADKVKDKNAPIASGAESIPQPTTPVREIPVPVHKLRHSDVDAQRTPVSNKIKRSQKKLH